MKYSMLSEIIHKLLQTEAEYLGRIGIRKYELKDAQAEFEKLKQSVIRDDMNTELEERCIRRDSNINRYFELTHTNFLVLPRTIMMDIPTEWQDNFVSLLEELDNKTKWRDELDDYNLKVFFFL